MHLCLFGEAHWVDFHNNEDTVMTSFYCTEHHNAIGSVYPIDWQCLEAIEKVDNQFLCTGNVMHVVRRDGSLTIVSDFALSMALKGAELIELIYTGGQGLYFPGKTQTRSA